MAAKLTINVLKLTLVPPSNSNLAFVAACSSIAPVPLRRKIKHWNKYTPMRRGAIEEIWWMLMMGECGVLGVGRRRPSPVGVERIFFSRNDVFRLRPKTSEVKIGLITHLYFTSKSFISSTPSSIELNIKTRQCNSSIFTC